MENLGNGVGLLLIDSNRERDIYILDIESEYTFGIVNVFSLQSFVS